MEMLRKFYKEEDGLGSVELVVLIGALMALALVFKNGVTGFIERLMQNVFQV